MPRAAELDALHALLRDAADFPGGAFDIVVRQAGQPNHPVRVVAGEIVQEVVVDAQHLVGGFRVLHLGAGGQDAVDDLGVDAVAVHVLDPQMRIARPAQALFEIVAVEAGLGHLVGAQLLAGDMRRAGGADAAAQSVLGTGVVGPALHPVRILGDVGHQVLELLRRVRGEQVGRQPKHVEMTVCRDTLIAPGHSPDSSEGDSRISLAQVCWAIRAQAIARRNTSAIR